MKRNQNFDHNHSQKVFSCRYNMDTNRVEARFEDGTTLSIDCIAIEDEYSNTPAQRAELDLLSSMFEYYLSWLRPWQTGRLTFFHRNVIGCYRMALQKALQKIRKLF